MNIYLILLTKPHNIHYLNRYYNFIIQCGIINSKRDLTALYTEAHHICPKASDLFPEYSKFSDYAWNKISLTAKQHYIAHHLLWKAYPSSSMAYTFKCFCDGYTSKDHDRLKFRITAKVYTNLKEANAEYCSQRIKNTVTVLNTITGKRYRVSKDEFDTSDHLVGASFGLNRTPKSEVTKERMRKPKSKAHAEKIRNNVSKLSIKNFVCCLVTRKVYGQNSWTRHYKVLYEPGYRELLGSKSSAAMKGKTKSESHKKASAEAAKLRNTTNRVSDIVTRKEYDLVNFTRWVLNRS